MVALSPGTPITPRCAFIRRRQYAHVLNRRLSRISMLEGISQRFGTSYTYRDNSRCLIAV